MVVTRAALSSTVQNLFGLGWSVIWIAGFGVIGTQFSRARRTYYRCFDWLRESWIVGTETPPREIRIKMLNLLFQAQTGDAQLECHRRRALLWLLALPVWLVGWGTVFVLGALFLDATGATR